MQKYTTCIRKNVKKAAMLAVTSIASMGIALVICVLLYFLNLYQVFA